MYILIYLLFHNYPLCISFVLNYIKHLSSCSWYVLNYCFIFHTIQLSGNHLISNSEENLRSTVYLLNLVSFLIIKEHTFLNK